MLRNHKVRREVDEIKCKPDYQALSIKANFRRFSLSQKIFIIKSSLKLTSARQQFMASTAYRWRQIVVKFISQSQQKEESRSDKLMAEFISEILRSWSYARDFSISKLNWFLSLSIAWQIFFWLSKMIGIFLDREFTNQSISLWVGKILFQLFYFIA